MLVLGRYLVFGYLDRYERMVSITWESQVPRALSLGYQHFLQFLVSILWPLGPLFEVLGYSLTCFGVQVAWIQV